MFGNICKRVMKSRKYSRVIEFLKYNFVLEDVTYSQNCEDLIVDAFFNKDEGFYVDVGAHHPYRFSNTYKLYLRGWSGINIDPLPNCMNEFIKYRPNDINLNIGINDEKGNIDYYCFEDPAFNTINADRADKLINENISKMTGKDNIDVLPLRDVFDQYLGERIIDFMNIDVETMELNVLKSNDWQKYKPKLIALESIVSRTESVENLVKDDAIRFLMDLNYIVIAKVGNAVFLSLND